MRMADRLRPLTDATTGPRRATHRRLGRGTALLLAMIALASIAACDRSDPTDPVEAETLASFDLAVPATVTEGQPFDL